ncbi:MAG: xanthine dehydrogenase family protein subunit M [Clostridia bacterium]|nr:xanthine dehydrogenase family protein subunit M [Clostridia bacterium]
MGSRILLSDFAYLAPTTLAEALQILAEKQAVKILAGGTDLLLRMKLGTISHVDYVMDIKHIKELNYACLCDEKQCGSTANGAFCIGPTATLNQIAKNGDLSRLFPAQREAILAMAATSVRNRGTMAGNICNASPVADSAIPAICYGAALTLQSRRGKRIVALEDFFRGPGETELEKDEMLVNIALPVPPADSGAAFIKKSRVKPDIAKISLGVFIERDGTLIKRCRIAMGSVAPLPLYVQKISEGLAGLEMNEQLIAKTAQMVKAALKPISDLRTNQEYRRAISSVLVEEGLRLAWRNAGGELK